MSDELLFCAGTTIEPAKLYLIRILYLLHVTQSALIIDSVTQALDQILLEALATIASVLALLALKYIGTSYISALFTGAVRRTREFSLPVPRWLTGPLISSEEKTARNTREIAAGLDELVAGLTSDVTDEGFEWLTGEQFDRERIDPGNCWRRPFNFAEVANGYPIDRCEGNGESMAETLISDLNDGGAAVVLGAPGAGKTTVCKSALVEWVREGGAVLYRNRGSGNPFLDMNPLRMAIEETIEENHVLVYVADAARSQNHLILKLAYEFRHDKRVSFLLDSRQSEWDEFRKRADEQDTIDMTSEFGQEISNLKSDYIRRRPVPELTEADTRRIIEQFKEKTEREVKTDPATVHEQISTGGEASAMLMLSYYLPVGGIEVSGEGEASALSQHVQEVYRRVAPDKGGLDSGRESELQGQAALCINVLNAAGLAVRVKSVYPLTIDDTEEAFVRELFNDEFDRHLVFGKNGDGAYWSNHEAWSMLYLDRHLSDHHPETARERFEECANAVFEATASDPEALREVIKSVFDIGQQRPKLAPLFGRTGGSNGTDDREVSGIHLPEASSNALEAKCALWRGHMYRGKGEYSTATAEYESYRELARESDIDPKRAEAVSLCHLGVIAFRQGKSASAKEHYQRSLVISEEIGSRAEEAHSLKGLGGLAYDRGEYEKAKKHFQRSLEISEEIDDRAGKAQSLNYLGMVARKQGEYEKAEDYHQQSLEDYEEIGDRGGKARSLGNLGKVAQEQGEYETQEKYERRSLRMFEEIGDRSEKARSLENLGGVAYQQGGYEKAKKYYQRSLEIYEEIDEPAGKVRSLHNLGLVAQKQDECGKAKEYYQRSLKICEDIDSRTGKAQSLNNLGLVAQKQGEYERAEDYHQRSLEIYHKAGEPAGRAQTLEYLGLVAQKQGEYEKAENYLQQSSEIGD